MNNKKIRNVKEIVKVNNTTGEVEEKEISITYELPREEDYVKVYLRHISAIHNLPKHTHPVIYELLKYVDYENQIILNSSVKQIIAEKMGVKKKTIDDYIQKFVREKILLRRKRNGKIMRGIYVLNPAFFGKGNWKNILELRKKLGITITYEEGKYIIQAGDLEE